MIVFEDVAKRYAGGYTALAGVSFEIRHGELVVLSGHSGAGKSTLFKLIPVIERPTAGRVLINGQDVSHLPKTAIPYLRRNLGLVLQESRLLFDRNVYDNVMLPLVITGHPPRDAAKRVAAAQLVISRSGASTVSEIAVIGRPALLVPYPHALDHDQAANAAALAAAGGAEVHAQSTLSVEKIAGLIGGLMNEPDRLGTMAASARTAGKPNAAMLLADLTEAIASGKSVAEFRKELHA